MATLTKNPQRHEYMNLVGKIITVMLFAMSLVFMAFAVMTYATDNNYKERVNGGEGGTSLSQTLNEARQKLEAREAELEQLKLRLAHEQGTRRAAIAALENKSREMSAQLANETQSFEALLAKHNQNIALISTSQKTIGDLKTEVDQARAQLEKQFQERDEVLKAIVEMTETLNQREGQLRRLKERNEQLTGRF